MTDQPPMPNRLTHEALLAGVAAQAGALETRAQELEDTAEGIRDSADKLVTAYRFSRQLKVILAFGVVVLAMLTFVAALNLRNGSEIRSCTTPSGDCYQRGQENTAKAIAQIVAGVNAHTDLVFLATLHCSRHADPASAAFDRCLEQRLTPAGSPQP